MVPAWKMTQHLAFLLMFSAISATTTTSMFKYALTDSTTNSQYSEGSAEYHCFDITAGVKTYVRGTYGSFGYFEGAVDNNDAHVFYVNWFETTAGTLTPTSGAATLTYGPTFLTTTGPYWSAGSSDISGSYGVWNSTRGVFVYDDSTDRGKGEMLEKCLYAGARTAAVRLTIAALMDSTAVSGSSGQGENTLCAMPAGPEGGAWLGAYTYEYGVDDGGGTEHGNYGTNPFAFWGMSGMGFVGTWHASTGSYAGSVGSNIYMVTGTASATYIVGFYCNVNDMLIKTECYAEYYDVTEANNNANKCPRSYRIDGSLDPLYEFAAIGSSESEHSGSTVPTAMAILFGCLSGVLMMAIAYMYISRSRAGKVSASASPV